MTASPAALSQPELEQIVARALDEARRAGASQAEAGVAIDAGLSVTVRLGEVETLEYQRDRSMGITVYVDGRKGSASTADLAWGAVADTVRKALSIARFTARDEFAGLADAELMARDVPDLDLYHPWDLDAEGAIAQAKACEAAALALDARVRNSEGASVSTHRGLRVYGNTHGFIGGYPSTSHSVSCVVLAQDGDDMQRDYWYDSARAAADLQAVEDIGRRAARRAVERLGARKLATRTAPVLFVPDIARGLIGHFVSAIRGGAQYRRSTFLLGAAGERLFPSWLSLRERPRLPRALGSAPFDNDGVATRERLLVDAGTLTGYVLDAYSARKLGLQTTGNAGGVHNLELEGGGGDFAALLQRLGTGLMVTELMGQGVNAVTGDYSRGAAGFWVQDGSPAFPVHEVTIAGNLRDMYAGIVAAGADLDVRGGIRTGSVLVGEMTIAGE